ncbi:MAG TPA: endonuclease/exonuclease/phosphatase family protein [Xanthomonadaceae bacterium]|nr:endonuclease/exonuclease/phosphatase family protein [Xanthomonadaceae bacterium]
MEIFFRLVLGACSLALVFATLLPLLHGSTWWIRIFDFPRMQIAVLLAVALAGYGWIHLQAGLQISDMALAGAVGLALGLQLFFIAPYTPLYPKQMQASLAENDDNRLSLFIYNVLHDNREVEPLRRLIRETDPDVILLSEPTPWWLAQLDGLEKDYPHTMLAPQENDYGMLLYSRFELIDPEVRFLVEPKIPSFRVKVRLRSGQVVTLYGVHPRPPGAERQEPQAAGAGGEGDAGVSEGDAGKADVGERVDADKRDAELLLVAKETAEGMDGPVIVGGDFNDVAWSHTTRLFQRIGGLLDPRIGRGLYNSFDARNPVMRYPLDHVFASGHFRFVELRRLPAIGSDHFPMLVVLDFDPTAVVSREEPEADAGDKEEADDAITEGTSGD